MRQPGGCLCRCHQLRAARVQSIRGPATTYWSPEEEEVLRTGISRGDTYKEISDELTKRSKTNGNHRPRSIASVRSHLSVLGLSVRSYWLTLNEVARVFHVTHSEVSRWRNLGHLEGKPWGTGSWWRFLISDIEKFVDTWSGILFHPEQLKGTALKHQPELGALYARAVAAKLRNTAFRQRLMNEVP